MTFEFKTTPEPPHVNKIYMPYRLHRGATFEVLADRYVRDDQVLLVDHEGHVHVLSNLGRLIDMPSPPTDLDGCDDDGE